MRFLTLFLGVLLSIPSHLPATVSDPDPGTVKSAAPGAAAANESGLRAPAKKEIAMELVSSAENSSLKWRKQFRYIQDIGDGRGYTAGIVGFCSGTGDMLGVVKAYTRSVPDNALAPYLPALRRVNNTDSHAGLGRGFVQAWHTAAKDPSFQDAQTSERDRLYFDPAVQLAADDQLQELGQFAYYDAAVVHGYYGLKAIRRRTLAKADPPSKGEDETYWISVFLQERLREMKKEDAHTEQLDRITRTQQRFLDEDNLTLEIPLRWRVNQTNFRITQIPD